MTTGTPEWQEGERKCGFSYTYKYEFQEIEEKQQEFDCKLKTPNKISLFWGVKLLPLHLKCGFKQKKPSKKPTKKNPPKNNPTHLQQ